MLNANHNVLISSQCSDLINIRENALEKKPFFEDIHVDKPVYRLHYYMQMETWTENINRKKSVSVTNFLISTVIQYFEIFQFPFMLSLTDYNIHR